MAWSKQATKRQIRLLFIWGLLALVAFLVGFYGYSWYRLNAPTPGRMGGPPVATE